MTLTLSQLAHIMPNAGKKAEAFLPYINKYAEVFRINTPLRMQHYLAQIAHESCELRYTKEIASGKAYEGRASLGNTRPGDGVRFKGRGLIQITGRANYTAYQKYCKSVDPTITWSVVDNPELLEHPLGATRSSMWYWYTHGLDVLADGDNILAITKRVNGGTNGLESRKKFLMRAKEVLK